MGAELSNIAFALKGVLIIDGDDCFVVANTETLEERITLQGDVLNKLLNKVPCYVGGKLLYKDKAPVFGLLSDLNNFILHPTKIIIERDGEEFFISLE